MKSKYKSVLKAGALSGLIWASLIEIANFVYQALYEPSVFRYGFVPLVYIGISTTFLTGIIFGVLIGLLCVIIHPKVLVSEGYPAKGTVVGIISSIIYLLVVLQSIPSSLILSTMLIGAFSGFIAGALYSKYISVQRDTKSNVSDYKILPSLMVNSNGTGTLYSLLLIPKMLLLFIHSTR